MITRRALVHGLASATLLAGSGMATAQAFPDKLVKIIVPRCEEAELPLERAGRRLLDKARAHG